MSDENVDATASRVVEAGTELSDELDRIAFAAHTCEVVGAVENESAPEWFNAGFLASEVAPRLRKYAALLSRSRMDASGLALAESIESTVDWAVRAGADCHSLVERIREDVDEWRASRSSEGSDATRRRSAGEEAPPADPEHDALVRDAARWRYFRRFLSVEDDAVSGGQYLFIWDDKVESTFARGWENTVESLVDQRIAEDAARAADSIGEKGSSE